MAYRNTTYVAFHGNDTSNPTESDIKYYNLMVAWEKTSADFTYINSHEKAGAIRDTSKKETLRRSIVTRMATAKNMVLIVGPTTQFDTDWVPYEINHAIYTRKIPIIVAHSYLSSDAILTISNHSHEGITYFLPKILIDSINKNDVQTLHIPFNKKLINRAISEFGVNQNLSNGINYYQNSIYTEALSSY